MRLLPRNLEAARTSEPASARPEVLRRYEITVEREFLAIRRDAVVENYDTFCRDCGRNVTMFPPDIAAALAGTTPRNVYRWVEEKRLHFAEPSSGMLFICSESLQQFSLSIQLPPSGAPELRDPNPPLLPGSSR